jgi:integrase
MDLKPAEPKRAVPRSEIFAVADYIRKNLKMGEMISDAFLFLAFTGARLTSGMSTKWEKVSFENNRIVLGKTKNGDPIYLPLWGPLREVLERARNERGCNPSHYIFPSYRAPGMPEDRPLKEFRHSISRACAALGIPRLTHHYLRHFFISEAVMVGIPAKTVAELVGHKDGGMLVSSTYSHLIPGHLEEMMGKLEKSYAVAEPRPPLVLLPKVA